MSDQPFIIITVTTTIKALTNYHVGSHHRSGRGMYLSYLYSVSLPSSVPDLIRYGWVCIFIYLVYFADIPISPYSTLIDSTPGVLQAWKTFARDYNLGDSEAVAHATHGRRLYDTLKEYCGITDEGHLLVCLPSQYYWLELNTSLERNR